MPREVSFRRAPFPFEASPPPVALVLLAAVYEGGGALELTFDRAIDVSGIVLGVILVDDGILQSQYVASAVIDQPSPASVMLELAGVQDYEGPDVRLNVAGGNGIVAVDDGGAWGGVTDLAIPFS
jgi:hypothetical protein